MTRRRPPPSAGTDVDPRFAPLVKEFTKDPRVAYEMLVTSWGLTVDGRIFAMMVKGALVLKLPRAGVETLVTEGQGRPFASGGRIMKDWMVVVSGPESWLELARDALAFVGARARS